MGIDASQDAIEACEQQVQSCFAALAPSFDAGAFPPFPDAGLQPPPFPDGGLQPPPFPDGGLQPPPFPPMPDAGFPPVAFPDGGAMPGSACFDKLNACIASSKDPQSCMTQAMSCLQGK
jgi:hypothetical protein